MTTTVLIVVGLMVFGLGLLALEVLVIPGIGVIGFLGAIGVLAAGYMAVTELPANLAGLTLAGGVAAAGLLFWLFPRTRLAKAMVLETQTIGGAGDSRLEALEGREAVAITPLRPAGTVEIDGAPVDVVSDGQYIEPGTRVRVFRVEGSRVMVEPIVVSSDVVSTNEPPTAAREELPSTRTEEI